MIIYFTEINRKQKLKAGKPTVCIVIMSNNLIEIEITIHY